MDLKAPGWLLLFCLVIALVGCASTERSADDNPPDLVPEPSAHDDSHGWGTSLQGGAH